jgi:uncharacterized protein YbgA (DUF1722 family)/uncharacterized protein YbbK (DUF523 family)
MRAFPRPVVVTSQCLELAPCRYNAQTIRAPFVRALAAHVELRPVCPEVEIGLGIPREPIRLVRARGAVHLVQSGTGRDLTASIEHFADRFLGSLGEVDGFILKSRSPSCGIKDTKLYGDAEAEHPVGTRAGLFGGAVLARFPHAAVEDEGRLRDSRLRHHFLTRVFARAAFRAVRWAGVADLVRFQTAHKLLLMARHQAALRRLGRIVAGAASRRPGAAAREYEAELDRALAAPARVPSTVSVLLHAMGYFKRCLRAADKRHFLSLVRRYGDGRITLAAPLALIQSWIERFGQEYLAGQTFFEPYPPELFDPPDSGRGGPGIFPV